MTEDLAKHMLDFLGFGEDTAIYQAVIAYWTDQSRYTATEFTNLLE